LAVRTHIREVIGRNFGLPTVSDGHNASALLVRMLVEAEGAYSAWPLSDSHSPDPLRTFLT